MSRFVLTAQLQLQAPNNVRQIVQQIQSQLNGVNVNVQIQNAPQAQRQLQQVTQQVNQATTAAERMGRAFALSIRRFAAFSIATRGVGLFTSTLSDAVQTSIDFERQLIKVAQVTGKSVGQLRGLTKQITNLSTSFGVASSDLLETSTVLAQAGLTAEDTAVALRTLAKAALAPNFDSISETAEGAIAILAQFQEGVGALEKQLGSINAVAGAFAVEASDLIDVVRRTGGVFKSSGGNLNELLALFTSVRATTRESAESIGTGLRTIFTRIQRPKTIEYLKQFGVELVDLNGKFVGPYEAIKRLSEALAGLGEGDITFIRIAEELGGFRQIGKVLPLLQQFSTAQSALNVAMKAGDSLTQDAASAQAALAIRIMKVREEFLALIRSVTETSTFQIMANTALSLASALIKIGDSIKPLLPMLAALATFRLAKGLGGFFGGMMSGATSGRTYNKGGKVLGFARGGMVPGVGNGDTVPAMLSPGEFVIRKSSVKKMGSSTLEAMNENRFALGGQARKFGIASLLPMNKPVDQVKATIPISDIRKFLSKKAGGKNIVKKGNLEKTDLAIRGILGLKGQENVRTSAISETISKQDVANKIEKRVELSIQKLIDNAASGLGKSLSIQVSRKADSSIVKSVGSASTVGSVFEGALSMLGAPMDTSKSEQDPIDFPNGLGPNFSSTFQSLVGIPVDAKRTATKKILKDTASRKAASYLANAVHADPRWQMLSNTSKQNLDPNKSYTLQQLGMTANEAKSKGYRGVGGLYKLQTQNRNLGGLIQKFADGGIVTRGIEKYSSSDVIKAMSEVTGRTLSEKEATDLFNSRNSRGDFVYTNFGGPGSIKLPKWLSTYKAKPSAAMQKFLAANSTLDANLNRPESYRGARASGRYRRYASGGSIDPRNTLERFYTDSSAFNLGLANSRGLGKSQRKQLASDVRDMRKLRSQAPSTLYSSISRVAFDRMASQVGLDKNPQIPEGTRLFDRAKYYQEAVSKIIGKVFSLPGFVSTSKDFGKAKSFLDNAPRADDQWAAMMTILTKSNAMGVDVASQLSGRTINATKQSINPRTGKMETFSMNQPGSESEFTLSPRSRFKINSAKFADMMGRKNLWMDVQQFAKGGGVGTDTVPALLTPGEFVVNRKSAQRIGYGALNRMNKVGKYASGGIVQHFSNGANGRGVQPVSTSSAPVFVTTAEEAARLGNACNTSAGQVKKSMSDVVSSNKMFAASMATSIIQGFLPAVDENSSGLLKATHSLMGLVTTVTSVGFALEAFGVALSANQILQLFGSGPGGMGSIISNAFKGFKMGASGQAGPMPLGGGFASRVGEVFGKGSNIFSNARSGLNTSGNKAISLLGGDTLSKGFSAGLSGKSVIGGGSRSLLGNIAGFAGQAAKGIKNTGESMGLDLIKPSYNFGKQGKTLFSLSGKQVPMTARLGNAAGRFTKGFGLGSSGKFSLTDIISGQGGKAGLSGKLGGILGKGAGSVGRFAAGTAARVGAVGGISGLGGMAAAAAGPATALVGILAAINSVVGGFRDLGGQLDKSIQAGKIEEASKLAVAKAASDFPLIGNLVGGWNDTVDSALIYIGQAFGGDSLDSVKALAVSQAGAVKTQKQLEKAQQTATKAMQDFENGSISASEALTKIRLASSEIANQEKRAGDFAINNTANMAKGGFTGRNVLSALTFGMVESSSQRNTRLGKQSAEQINQAAKFQSEAFQMESPARQAAIRSGVARGKGIDQVRKEAVGNLQQRLSEQRTLGATLQQAGDEEGAKAAFAAAEQLESQLKQVNDEIRNIAKEVENAKKSFEAMNLGLRSATATASALSASMDNFSAGLEVGGSTFVSDVEFLQQSLSSAAQAMNPDEIKGAVQNVSDNLRKFGSSEKYIQKFEGNIMAFTQAQSNYNKAFDNIKKSISNADFKNISADDLKKKFADELTKGMGPDVSDEAKKNLKDVIQGIELSTEDVDKIVAGDLSVFGDKLSEAQKKMLEDVQKIAQERAKAEQVLIDFTKKRIDAERNLVQAQQEALDLTLEGREVQAKYGGRAVSFEEKRANLLGKSNAESNRLGLTGMKTGSIEELRARNAEIKRGFSDIEGRRTQKGGMANKEGVVADETQKDLQKAYKTQIETIRGLIKLEEEQLKITQEKNKLERDSMESLIKGDVEEFFKKQSAVGATAAIASGDQRLMNYYGADALGMAYQDIQRQQEAGVQSLYGQQLAGTGGLVESAASAALSSRGVTDMRAAQVMAGTTAEEEASKSRLRELGGMLGETGQLGVDMAEMQVNTSVVNLTAAQVKFDEVMRRGNEKAEEAQRIEGRTAAQSLSRGGVVYASRGIFVPRGTDTIPAMLTPGEFVVNRNAVQRGNNLQILQSMNGNTNASTSGGGTAMMARGGVVRYRQDGSAGPESSSNDAMSKFAQSLNEFNLKLSDNIQKLSQTNISIKLDSTAVNINLNDGGLLKALTGQVKTELFKLIESEFKVDNGGRLKRNSSVMGN